MSIKIDLHTHSVASHDGGISVDQYCKAFDNNLLDCIAITDHNRIDFAQELHQKLGKKIIVGEEIMSAEGEIVGLFLTEKIPAGLTAKETVKKIRQQNGVVYIPHPFETVRKGLHPATLDDLVNDVDIIEACNGRAFFQNRSQQAVVWAKLNKKLSAASSDAHGYQGLGPTHTVIPEIPTTPEMLIEQMNNSVLITGRPTVRALLYPKINKLRKKIGSNR